jgi:amidase
MTLEVIAGSNGLDPRQPIDLYPEPYTEALVEDVNDLRIGILQEGFEVPEHDERINKIVWNAISEFSTLGAKTTNVSLPLHHDGVTISFMIWAFGSLQMFKNGGQGTLLDGWYDTELMKVFERYRRRRANMLPPEGKATLLAMEYLDTTAGVITYGKAQNLQHRLHHKVDQLFDDVDLLALPTMPTIPFKLDAENENNRSLQTITLCQNTATFSLTKHPSISIPCRSIEGIPVGLMLVADRFDEQTLLRAAHTFEQEAEDHFIET